MKFKFLLSFLLFFCLSCDNNDVVSIVKKEVIVYLSPNGLGDFGYNDDIMRGVQLSTLELDFDLTIVVPDDLIDGDRLIIEQAQTKSPKPKLIVLCTDIYEASAQKIKPLIADNVEVLLFETDNHQASTYTFTLDNYQGAYLAGSITAAFKDRSSVICANSQDIAISKTKDGFITGFKSKASATAEEVNVHYLSENIGEGYAMTSVAYHLSKSIYKNSDVIFPILGGGAIGVYRYTREFDNTYVVGMDRDQEGFSDGVFISLVKRMDLLVSDYITKWVKGEHIESHQVYGLESQYLDVVISGEFSELLEDKYEQYRLDAIENGSLK